MNHLYSYFLSAVILIASYYFAWHGNLFDKEYLEPQIFLIAMLCGWSIREVWTYVK